MKPWIKRTLIAITGIVVVAGSVAACSHREHGPRGGQVSAEDVAKWRGRFLDRATKELQLDTTQQQRLGLLYDKLNEQRLALLAGSDPRSTVTALIAGERFDRSRATALLDEKSEALKLKSPGVIAAAADFFDGLNPQQQAQVREFLAKKRGGHGHRG
ncbi:MAG: hypothetical protein WAQ05_17890 [Rubrivivax sp.]